MKRFLGLIAVFAVALVVGSSSQESPTPTRMILEESYAEDFLRNQMATSRKPEDASMDELSARLAWVLRGKILPDDVRTRTILRAKSSKEDLIGPFGFRHDSAPSKRALSMAIIALDDALLSKEAEAKLLRNEKQ